MQRFKNILVHISTDKPLQSKLHAAADIARRNDATLTLFDVVPTLPVRRRIFNNETSQSGCRRSHGRGSTGETEIHRSRARRRPDRAFVRPTEPATSRSSARALAHNHDLIITAPDEPRRNFFAGAATTMHLMRKSPVPVWVHSAGSIAAHGVAVAVGLFDTERRRHGS